MAARCREDVPRSRLLARHHADRPAGAGDTPCAGQDRAGPWRRADQLPGIGRNRRSARVRLPRRGNPRARPRRRPAAEHSGIRLHLLRTRADRRDSGHRAARAPAHGGRAFPARFGRRRVCHPRCDQGLRLPRDGAGARAEGAGIAGGFRGRRTGAWPTRHVDATRDTGRRRPPFGRARGPRRSDDDAAVGRDDIAVEAHSPHPR